MRIAQVSRIRYAIVLSVLLTACSTTAAPPTPDPLAGTYTGFGSATTLDQAQVVTAAFAKLHPGVTFHLNVTDTESSIVKVRISDPDADFGFIARELLPSDGAVQTTLIGATGSAFAVNTANPVHALTKANLAALLTGQFTDWSAVGGSGPVKLIIREPTSQTRSSLEVYVFGANKPVYPSGSVITEPASASSQMIDALTAFKGALGMVTIDSATLSNKNIVLVMMDGIAPTPQNAATGVWPVRRAQYLVSNVDQTKVKPAIRALIDYLKSPAGQKVIAGQ